MLEALQRARTRAYISNHAGTFLCNHVFYVARQELARLRHEAPCGFVHLPGKGAGQRSQAPSVKRLAGAVERCLKVVARDTARKRGR
jgi:pyrrolidone-carboxylate peptidase